MSALFWTALALATAESDFAEGHARLAAGDLAGAEAAYRSVLSSGMVDADVYYDLGNVLYREEHVPLAIVAWRRAAVLDPRDPDVQANLSFARRDLVDDVVADDPVPVWAPWQAGLTGDEGQWIGATLAGTGLLAVALRRRRPHLPLGASGAGGAALGALIAAGGAWEAAQPAAAVVVAESVTARSDLGGGVDLFVLHAGAEVAVLEAASGNALVQLPDGRKGWAAEADLVTLDPYAPMPAAAESD